MAKRVKLTSAEISAGLGTLAGWKTAAGTIKKEFKFADFSEAFGFMARVALAADKMDHHPDWSNVYNRVEIRLSTHDAGGVTALDMELAGKIDALAKSQGRKTVTGGSLAL